MPSIYKVARKGKHLGEFGPWELKNALEAGKLLWTDDYWTSGMAQWAKLETIRPQLLSAQQPAPAQPSGTPPPPLPPGVPPPQATPDGADKTNVNVGAQVVGTLVFLVGGLVTLSGLTSSPEGSAIRQGVIVQHMTNGILLMILGVLIAKR